MPLPYKTDSTVFYPMAGRRSITGPETRTRIKKRYRETNRRPWSVCLIVDLKSLITVIIFHIGWDWAEHCDLSVASTDLSIIDYYFPAEANNWSARHWQIHATIFCNSIKSMLLFFAGHLMGSPRMKRKKKCSKWSNYFWPIYKMFALLKLHMVLQLQLVCISKACLHQFCRSI